jgi:hypothetical protein
MFEITIPFQYTKSINFRKAGSSRRRSSSSSPVTCNIRELANSILMVSNSLVLRSRIKSSFPYGKTQPMVSQPPPTMISLI